MTSAAGRTPAPVVIVGTGLIGTSVGLALTSAGVEVLLADRDEQRVRLAADLGAGRGWQAGAVAQHVLLAVPPAQLPDAVLRWQAELPDSTFSDVSSVQVEPRRAAAAGQADLSRWCGGHPMAGRERSGPAAARGDLFAGRTWVLCPDRQTSAAARADAEWVARTCRAQVSVLDPAEHDQAVALVSHLPQLVASLLAAQLDTAPEQALLLAAQGLRDTTRLAGSDPQLWAEIVAANSPAVLAVLGPLQHDLGRLVEALRLGEAAGAVDELVRRGSVGRRRLPGKHGGRVLGFAGVPVVVADQPGELARLLADAATAGVNIEDLTVEHDSGRPVGVIELTVKPERIGALAEGLRDRGWAVHAAQLAEGTPPAVRESAPEGAVRVPVPPAVEQERPALAGPRDAARLVVAVDGPSGSGKSSVSRRVAERLELRYLDTGAMYRAVTWRLLEQGVDVDDSVAVAAAGPLVRLDVEPDPVEPRLAADGHPVGAQIRGPQVSRAVSSVSAVPAVRHHLVALQRDVIAAGGIVVEGRDIGAVVAPDADVKVYLTASGDTRAVRRAAELTPPAASSAAEIDRVRAALERRDALDSSRAASPLRRADGAVVLDATDLTLEQVVDEVLALCAAVSGMSGLSGLNPTPNPTPAPARAGGRP